MIYTSRETERRGPLGGSLKRRGGRRERDGCCEARRGGGGQRRWNHGGIKGMCACRRKKEEQGNKIRVIETFHFVQLRGK